MRLNNKWYDGKLLSNTVLYNKFTFGVCLDHFIGIYKYSRSKKYNFCEFILSVNIIYVFMESVWIVLKTILSGPYYERYIRIQRGDKHLEITFPE